FAVPFEHRCFEIIVEVCSGDTAQIGKSIDMTLKKVLQALVEEELEVEGAAVGERENKAGEAPSGASDGDLSERGPIDLSLFAGQDRKPQEGFFSSYWAQLSDQASQL